MFKFRQAQYDRDGNFTEFHYWGLVDGAFVQPQTGNVSITKALENSQRYLTSNTEDGSDVYEGDIVDFHYFYMMAGSEAEHTVRGEILWMGDDHFTGHVLGCFALLCHDIQDTCRLTGEDDLEEGDTAWVPIHELWGHEISFTVVGNNIEK